LRGRRVRVGQSRLQGGEHIDEIHAFLLVMLADFHLPKRLVPARKTSLHFPLYPPRSMKSAWLQSPQFWERGGFATVAEWQKRLFGRAVLRRLCYEVDEMCQMSFHRFLVLFRDSANKDATFSICADLKLWAEAVGRGIMYHAVTWEESSKADREVILKTHSFRFRFETAHETSDRWEQLLFGGAHILKSRIAHTAYNVPWASPITIVTYLFLVAQYDVVSPRAEISAEYLPHVTFLRTAFTNNATFTWDGFFCPLERYSHVGTSPDLQQIFGGPRVTTTTPENVDDDKEEKRPAKRRHIHKPDRCRHVTLVGP